MNLHFLELNGVEELIIKNKQFKNKRIIIFTISSLLQYLCKSKFWLRDGTFKIVPNIVQQLYINELCEKYSCVNEKKKKNL